MAPVLHARSGARCGNCLDRVLVLCGVAGRCACRCLACAGGEGRPDLRLRKAVGCRLSVPSRNPMRGRQRDPGVAGRFRASANYGAPRRNPGRGASLRSEARHRGVQGSGNACRGGRAAVADGQLEDRPQQHRRSPCGAATRLHRVRRSHHRSPQRIGPDAAGAGHTCRIAQPVCGRIDGCESRGRGGAADQWRQRPGAAPVARQPVRCRCARQIDRSEGSVAETLAASNSARCRLPAVTSRSCNRGSSRAG